MLYVHFKKFPYRLSGHPVNIEQKKILKIQQVRLYYLTCCI